MCCSDDGLNLEADHTKPAELPSLDFPDDYSGEQHLDSGLSLPADALVLPVDDQQMHSADQQHAFAQHALDHEHDGHPAPSDGFAQWQTHTFATPDAFALMGSQAKQPATPAQHFHEPALAQHAEHKHAAQPERPVFVHSPAPSPASQFVSSPISPLSTPSSPAVNEADQPGAASVAGVAASRFVRSLLISVV